MPDESEGFVVRDRRRFLNDVETPATPPAPPTPPTPPTPPVSSSPAAETEDEDDNDEMPLDAAQFAAFMNQMAAMQGLQGGAGEDDDMQALQQAGGYPEGGEGEDTTLPDIYSVLVMFLNEMRTHALLRLGLVPNPMTGQSEQDLEQARVAIDTLGFLVGQLEPVVAPEERLPIRAMVSDLQMQFARQSQGAQ